MSAVRRWIGAWLVALGGLAGVLVGWGEAQAGDWTLDNGITVGTTFSDNIRQRPDGGAGFRIDVSPRVALQGRGGRVSGNLAYSPSVFGRFGDGENTEGVNHYLNSRFNGNLVRNVLFFDASASAGLVSNSTATNFGADGGDYGNDASQTYTLALAPYTRHRFGSHADLMLRADVNHVGGSGSAQDIGSTSRTLSARLSSGRRFARAPWSLLASSNETEYDDRTDKRDSFQGALGYRINRIWRVDGNLGYEDNQVVSGRSDTSGMTYSATLFWTPTPRTNMEAQFGKRYFGDSWRVAGEHRSRRTLLSLDLSREVTSARNRIFDDLNPQANDGTGSGDPFDTLPDSIIFVNPNAEDYLSTRVNLGVVITGRRTTVSTSIDWDQRQYEVSGNEEDVMLVTISANRQLSGSISANARASWQDVQSTLSNDSQHWRFGLGLSQSLGRYSSVGVDASRQERTGDTGNNYVEHRIGVSFSTRMF